MMTSAQVVETSVTVTDNSSFQDYPQPDDHTILSIITVKASRHNAEAIKLKPVLIVLLKITGKNSKPSMIESFKDIVNHKPATFT